MYVDVLSCFLYLLYFLSIYKFMLLGHSFFMLGFIIITSVLYILECEVKWALGSITMNKASGGDGIPVELFQLLKDDAVKVLHSICQQIWKTQQ